MEQRTLGSTGRNVSIIGLGTWQLGADWGDTSDADAEAVMGAAIENGVTFFDTADVYGDGRSEQRIAAFRASHPEVSLMIATKMGRRVDQVPGNFTLSHFRAWVDRSRHNLEVDALDLVQLHCPPAATIEDDATWAALETLRDDGVIAAYGVSVETCDQALTAIERGAATVQIIINAFRLKPLDEVLPAALAKGVGIIARVPLASGLLAGRYTEMTTFAPSDHRSFNRHGEAFDVGETFSGVDYEVGVAAAKAFVQVVEEYGPSGASPAQVALAWVAQQPGVTTVIPGARNAVQAKSNADAGHIGPLSADLLDGVTRIYDTYLRDAIHPRW